MNSPDPSLQKLFTAARRAPRDSRDEAAPFGFATRVAALALQRPEPAAVFGRFALRAAAVSAVLAVAAVAANFTAIRGLVDEPSAAAPVNNDDPVSEVVALGS